MARDDFSGLRDGKKMPEVRHELLTTLKAKLIPLNVLDEFKSAGVFVNWWQQIRYDLKTIISTGWHHSLIPDEYLIAEYFQTEADEIETLEAQISEAQSELAEAVETAQEVAAYEPEEDETVTAAVIKKALKELIDDLKGSTGDSARKELENLQAQEKAITAIEKRIKESRAALKIKTDELELKLQLKRLGGDEFKAESQELIRQVDAQLANLDSANKDDKKKITALNKDKAALASPPRQNRRHPRRHRRPTHRGRGPPPHPEKALRPCQQRAEPLPQCRKARAHCRGGKPLGQIRRLQPGTGGRTRAKP